MRQSRAMLHQPTVFVVDEEAQREACVSLLRGAGLRALAFPSAQEFLAAYDPAQPGCLVAQVSMPGMDALELQTHLREKNIDLPILFLAAKDDVPTAVQALRAGALNFLEKPAREDVLLTWVQRALEIDGEARRALKQRQSVERYARLTPREHEVLELMVKGHINKVIASRLKVAVKTVEFHRKNIMKKMEADNLAALLGMLGTTSKRSRRSE